MKNFKTFMTEHPSYNNIVNDDPIGFGDPMVIKKLNDLMGKLTSSESFTDGEPVVRQIRSSLSKIGLTFDEVPAMSEDKGNFSMPLTLYGGRFGKLPETPHDEFASDDGISHQVEGGLTLVIGYEMNEDNSCRLSANIK